MKIRILLMLLMLCVSSTAFAQSKKPKAAILDLRGEKVEGELISTFSSIIRNEAQQLEKYQVVNKVPINLDDVLLALGCSSPTTPCLDQAAKQLKVQVLVYGELKKVNDALQVTVKLFDSNSDKILNRLTRTIESTDDPAIAFRREVQSFFSAHSDNPTTRLQIGSNVTGAEIKIEGTMVGRAPLERKGLPPGEYNVEVSDPKHDPFTTKVILAEGEDVSIWAKLNPIPGAVIVDSKKDPVLKDGNEAQTFEQPNPILKRTTESRLNWPALAVAGVGLAAVGTSLIFGAMIQNTETEIEDARQDGTLTARRFEELRDQGESQQLIHYILLGTGVGVAAGGLVWFALSPSSSETVTVSVSPNRVNATILF